MTTDKELADRVVALLGGRSREGRSIGPPYYFQIYEVPVLGGFREEAFVRDWRVAGALMERCADKPLWADITVNRKCRSEVVARCWVFSPDDQPLGHGREDSLPRAIISACVEALEAK